MGSLEVQKQDTTRLEIIVLRTVLVVDQGSRKSVMKCREFGTFHLNTMTLPKATQIELPDSSTPFPGSVNSYNRFSKTHNKLDLVRSFLHVSHNSHPPPPLFLSKGMFSRSPYNNLNATHGSKNFSFMKIPGFWSKVLFSFIEILLYQESLPPNFAFQ